MKTFPEGAGQSLEWRQPRFRRQEYELLARGDVIATITFASRSGNTATVTTARGSWTFTWIGYVHPQVTARAAGSTEDEAVFSPSLLGAGELRFADGETFQWRPLGFWRSQWAFWDSRQRSLVTFKPWPERRGLADLFKTHILVEIDARAAGDARLALFATMGLYLMLMNLQEAALLAAIG
jgi:hypothetical protein